MTQVLIVGGGIAGLTAAHELIERGYSVTLCEQKRYLGGKAASQPVAGTGTGGRRDLPGEHGFRFYPRFYKHIIDTMARIPNGRGGTVADHLRATTESAIASIDDDTWYRFGRKRIENPMEVIDALDLFFKQLDFDPADVALFAAKFLQFFTSCDARRLGEYENQSWYAFCDGDAYSPNFARQLRAIPRTMVAMDPIVGSANTIGLASMQLILDYASSGVTNDRTMGGPTSEMWIDIWADYLRDRGVVFIDDAKATALPVQSGKLAGVAFADGTTRQADYYVLAVPIDVAIGLMSPELMAADPQLARLGHANTDQLVSWMTGVQYFLVEDVPIVRGHVYFPDAPWGLTCISQAQFWQDGGLFRRRYGDGTVGGILSVDVCLWDQPGLGTSKTAKQCTRDEFAREVWYQLKLSLNGREPGDQVLRDDLLHSYHVDWEVDFTTVPPRNQAPLLVHPPGHWALRPEAGSAIPNLVLAGDYIRTHTNLATMEGANEAARRAVNEVLARSASHARPANIWPLEEPAFFAPWKQLDARLHAEGYAHLFDLLGIRHATRAMDLLRRFRAFTGLEALDDLLDDHLAGDIIRRLAARLGL